MKIFGIKKKMKIKDKDEIVKRMMSGSETLNMNKIMKVFRKKNKDGKTLRSSKNKMGRHLNLYKKLDLSGEEKC